MDRCYVDDSNDCPDARASVYGAKYGWSCRACDSFDKGGKATYSSGSTYDRRPEEYKGGYDNIDAGHVSKDGHRYGEQDDHKYGEKRYHKYGEKDDHKYGEKDDHKYGENDDHKYDEKDDHK